MQQPELGKKIASKRNEMGLTQEQLAEKTNINIRTIQRIESGNVMPRASTLGIILEILCLDFKDINGNNTTRYQIEKPEILKAAWIAGIIYTVIFTISVLPVILYSINHVMSLAHPIAIIHIISIALVFFFDRGKIYIGKVFSNEYLLATGIADIILITVNNIILVFLLYNPYPVLNISSQYLLSLIGLNGIFYGVGILLLKQYRNDLIMATGIVVIFESMFWVIPVGLFNLIGCFVCIPSMILQTIMFYQIYTQHEHIWVSVNN